MSFFTQLISSRVPQNNRLRKLDALIDWGPIKKILHKRLSRGMNPIAGVKPYDVLSMFKAILLQSWHSLSDPQLEEALQLRFDFLLFANFEVEDSIPDETTICRFRNHLVEKGLDLRLFKEINRQLEEKGIKVKNSQGAVVDATIVESAARPRRQIEVIAEDRKEEESPRTTYKVQESCDADARWLKKGKRYYYGYKIFASTDVNEGFIEDLSVTGANQSETTYFPEFIEKLKSKKGKRIYADKGYASQANRDFLNKKGLKDGIMEKGARGKILRDMQKIKNKLISKKRYIVEQTFGTLKRRLCFHRARYMTLKKVEGEAIRKAMCLNLIKALKKVDMRLPKEINQIEWC